MMALPPRVLRLVVPSMPELANKGAFAQDHTYTLAEIDALLEYARMRGIRVVLEIDMYALPLFSSFGYKRWFCARSDVALCMTS